MKLSDTRMLVLVGLTGVGKTTTVEALERSPLDIRRLPNRRQVTDETIIAWLQDQDGEPRRPISDRSQRFDYTRRYRERFPGGMAHALTRVDLTSIEAGASEFRSPWYLFDGLRGANEVEHAARLFKRAHFLLLTVPNAVRVARLLDRGDAFDRVASPPHSAIEHSRATDAGVLIDRHRELLGDSDPRSIEFLVQFGRMGTRQLHELEQKLTIVEQEHRNYSALATLESLDSLAKERTTVARTDQSTPEQIVHRVLTDLQKTISR